MSFQIKKIRVIFVLLMIIQDLFSQYANITGKVIANDKPVEFANVFLVGTTIGSITDTSGYFNIHNIPPGEYTVRVTTVGFEKLDKHVILKANEHLVLNFDITQNANVLNEVVVTGTMKEVSRLESPVNVEVYTPTYFKKNPTSSVYEAMQNINGVRPQLNCNICNTGDIHINGMEGPYTMVLIDGMPIVSSLSTVYGLFAIPNSLLERVEIIKGPASSLYGSEAVGGLINIITKKPQNAPTFFVDAFGTSWGEYNTDLAFKFNAGKKVNVLTSMNYFNFQNRVDKNHDNFTDMALQNRISVFQKWNFDRKDHRLFTMAARFMYEDRFGGQMNWSKQFRGSDSIYGESIYTKRWELIGNYQLPTQENIVLSFSFNLHDQNSMYGLIPYLATQNIAFSQLTWDKKINQNDWLVGIALRYTYYDDNTIVTTNSDTLNPQNQPQKIWLPGVFIQDEIRLSDKHKLLVGFRYDYNSYHGNIYTPRLAYKWSINANNIFRLNAGTGFRVVNLFTEDHAAMTGSRQVEIQSTLRPERSYNINLNYIKKIYSQAGTYASIDVSAFYTYFTNKIIGDYETDPNKIIYDNLKGYAQNKGISVNIDASYKDVLKIIMGGTLMDNTFTQNGITRRQLLSENFAGVWAISYTLKKANLTIDYTGNVYSPMRLPLLSERDPRKPMSPWWSIQNLQMVYDGWKNIQIYAGVKNLLDWTPFKENNPFVIARSEDPFDKKVQLDTNGQVIPTPDNPYGLTFDTSYVYAPTQGIRVFFGFRYNF